MGFQSVNEIEKFSFEDCQISSMQVGEKQLKFEVEALIVKSDNSQNSNFTDSYAGTAILQFENAEILSGARQGYRHYDADGVLIEEIPDKALSKEEIRNLPKIVEGVYLLSMEKEKEENGKLFYAFELEFQEERDDNTIELKVRFEKAVFSWNRYLNRVQR